MKELHAERKVNCQMCTWYYMNISIMSLMLALNLLFYSHGTYNAGMGMNIGSHLVFWVRLLLKHYELPYSAIAALNFSTWNQRQMVYDETIKHTILIMTSKADLEEDLIPLKRIQGYVMCTCQIVLITFSSK